MKNKQYDYLIVGSGLFAAVFCRMVTDSGKHCLVLEKRNHIGGNLFCKNIDGINVHMYGAHIFHTDRKNVWDFVNRYTTFNHFVNSPLACYKDKLYNLPFNMNTFYQLWGVRTPADARAKINEQRAPYLTGKEPANLEEQALMLCGEDIYYHFIKEYTEKQWGCSATELPSFIIRRIPFRFIFDNNYFNDPWQGIPIGGYNPLIQKLFEGVEVKCNTNYFEDRTYFDSLAGNILFTGCIDEFFGYEYGKLSYRSLRFDHKELSIADFQGNAIVNYNEKKVPYTRIIEHKHFEFGNQSHTVITKEYPQSFTGTDEPYYPVNDEHNMKLLQKYKENAAGLDHLLFGGRLAQYAYFDMDDTIDAALTLAVENLNA